MNRGSNGKDLTLGTCLTALWRLANGQHGTQSQWFAVLWASYYAGTGDDRAYQYQPDASQVNRIVGSKCGLPKPMYAHYGSRGDLLAGDVDAYLSKTIVSGRQHHVHMQTLRDMVDHSDNLLPVDKAYILDYTTAAEADQLAELVYRMLLILIREPIDKAA